MVEPGETVSALDLACDASVISLGEASGLRVVCPGGLESGGMSGEGCMVVIVIYCGKEMTGHCGGVCYVGRNEAVTLSFHTI